MHIGPLLTAKKAMIACRAVCMGDVIVYKEQGSDGMKIGKVFFHAEVDGQLWCCVSAWRLVSFSDALAKCVVTDNHVLVRGENVVQSCIFWDCRVGEISQVIVPSQ